MLKHGKHVSFTEKKVKKIFQIVNSNIFRTVNSGEQ